MHCVCISYKLSLLFVEVFAFGKRGFLPTLWHISVYWLRSTMSRWRKNKWCPLFIAHIILLYHESHTKVCSAHMRFMFLFIWWTLSGWYNWWHFSSLWFFICNESITFNQRHTNLHSCMLIVNYILYGWKSWYRI